MNKRPTIVDVARHAGVSKSTVSLVLQNSPLVRPSTRDEVEKSMGALNYVYNRSAANLRGADVGLIGLVINDLRNPFFTEFAASAQMTFASRGYATVIANTDENPEHPGAGDRLDDRAWRLGLPDLADLRRRGRTRSSASAAPASRRCRCCAGSTPAPRSFPFASLDYATGGRLATEHLLGLGARRIAFVGGLREPPGHHRAHGRVSRRHGRGRA